MSPKGTTNEALFGLLCTTADTDIFVVAVEERHVKKKKVSTVVKCSSALGAFGAY